MLKRLDVGASYQPSKRTESWIKIKRCAPRHGQCFAWLGRGVTADFWAACSSPGHTFQ